MSWRTANVATGTELLHKCNRICTQIGMYLMNDYLLFKVLYSQLSLAVIKLYCNLSLLPIDK